MINLLPTERKREYSFARRNRHLLRWVISLSCVLVGLILLTGLGLLYLRKETDTYKAQSTATSAQLQKEGYEDTKKKIETMSNNLSLTISVLSKQIMFSELLDRLGALMPANTRLTGLSITQAQGAIDISASAIDYNAATQLQANLADTNNGIFSRADLVNTNCGNTADTYPCKIVIRALFAPNNPFMFISNSTTKSGKAAS